jgi:hypothetical protein
MLLVIFLSGVIWGYGTDKRLSLTNSAYVLAAESTTSNVYLPVLVKQYPLETIFGVEMHSITDPGGFQQVKGAGTTWIRLNGVLWDEVEANEGDRDWSVLANLESQLKKAAADNIRVVLIVRRTPSWAQKLPGSYCGPVKESKLGAFADFMYDLVRRYSVSPYNVKYWEMGNEPDVAPELAENFGDDVPFGCWGDPGESYYGGQFYAEMLKQVYPKIKAADPHSQVVVGGLLLSCDNGTVCPEENSSRFFEGILVNDGGNYFDGISFHSYEDYLYETGRYGSSRWNSAWDSSGPSLIAKADFLRDLLDQYEVPGKYLMNTESALLCGGFGDPPGGPGCESDPNSAYEITKAFYIAQSFAAAHAAGLRANIWYSVSGWRNSGLLYSDLTPRPAYAALKFAREKLGAAKFEREIDNSDLGGSGNIKGYIFNNHGGSQIWVLWSLDGLNYNIYLPEPPSGVWDALGNPVSTGITQSLDVTIKPLYVEFAP